MKATITSGLLFLVLLLALLWAPPVRAEDQAKARSEAKTLYLEAFTQQRFNPKVAARKLERVIARTEPANAYHQKAVKLLAELRDPEARAVQDARKLYLEAYTLKTSAPQVAIKKLEKIIATTKPENEHHRRAVELIARIRQKTRAPKKSAAPKPAKVEPYTGPIQDPFKAIAEADDHLKNDRFPQAIAMYQHALELESRPQPLVHRKLGIAYARHGDACRSARHYQRYLAQDPDAKDAVRVRQILHLYRRSGEARARCPG